MAKSTKTNKEKDSTMLEYKIMSKDDEKGSRSKITKHEGTSFQRRQIPRSRLKTQEHNNNTISKSSKFEGFNDLASGDIVSLKILSLTQPILSPTHVKSPQAFQCSQVKDDYNFGMEIPDSMISNAIKKSTGYNYYMAKKKESTKDKIIDEPEEQHVSPIKSGRGKGSMCYGDQAVNVPKKDVVPRKIRYLTIAEEIVVDIYVEWGQNLKVPVVEDPVVQSLLDLQKGSKTSRPKSLKQKKQSIIEERPSKAHNKHYAYLDTNSDAILYSLCSEESEDETDDADDSDMDLSDDNPQGNDDATGFGVFMYKNSTETPTLHTSVPWLQVPHWISFRIF
ncbi:hypothetical protein Tco_0788065 [Tanacetum coccineum]